jgi:asparagine synthase (glutamine-hydrolysing)
MCGIAGIISKNNQNRIGKLLKRMLQTMQHRGPDGAGFTIGGIVERKRKLNELNFDEKEGNIGLGHVRLAITGGIDGLQPFQSNNGRLSLLHNGEIYNYRKLRSELNNNYKFETDTDSEVILKLLEKHYEGDLSTAVKQILPKLDGVYALAVTDNKQTVIARDKIGVRQLYFYTDDEYFAFASEKKPLISICGNFEKIRRLLPGHMITIEANNVQDFVFWTPESIWPTRYINDKKEALKAYGQTITDSIIKRTADQKRVGVIFSGGIDSFLIAHKLNNLNIPFTCYTAGRNGASDIEWASNLADKYNFPIKIKQLTLEEIENLIPQIIMDIEDYSLNQVEVAIPIYASVRMAQENGERVILTGQGADELFGGYPWYSKIVDQEGYKSFEQYSWNDTFLLYKECLEREDKIAMAHSIELRVPYLDPAVIKVAFQISPKLKISCGNDQLGKRIHREFCVSIGIPERIAFRKKEAAQHGANIHNVFEILASKTGVNKACLEKAGYDPNKSIMEKLGSSSRYGFLYGDHHLWKPMPQVQYYLDSHAANINLLSPKSKSHWEEVTCRLEAKGTI